MEKRKISLVFVKDYKSFILTFNKKDRSDYILNVSKLIKDKFSTKFIIPNKVQSFLLNYEITKLLDKAITVKNEKYNQIIYLNQKLFLNYYKENYHNIHLKVPDLQYLFYKFLVLM